MIDQQMLGLLDLDHSIREKPRVNRALRAIVAELCDQLVL